MKLSSHIAFLLHLTAASAATTKVIRRSVESTRSLSSFDKQQKYLAKLPTVLAENGGAVAAARHGSDVSVQCFTETITDYEVLVTDDPDDQDCAAEGSFISCDYSSIGLSACTEAGGTILRETLNYCEENFIATNYPVCISPSCDQDVTYAELMIDFSLPVTYSIFGGEENFGMTLEEFIYMSGFGTCDATPSSKAPKSSKAPSSKAPKSSKAPSSKSPKSSKAPSSKAPKSSKAPSSKAPKSAPSSKAPKSTKAPGAQPGEAASSSATASMSAASVAAGALVWFSL